MADKYTPPDSRGANFNFDIAGYVPKPPLDADFDFALNVYRILAGQSNIFTGIWADSNAGRNKGKMYVLSWGPNTALSVLDLNSKYLYDHYTENYGGRAEESLDSNDTRDLNVKTP